MNGVDVARQGRQADEQGVLEIHLARKRKPSAIGYLLRNAQPLPEEQRGVAISTLGKVIKHGWDWLGISPAARERIGGLIGVPALAACLTLNKGDFIRVGPRGATYLAYRKAIQEAVSRQLALWGDCRKPVEDTRRRTVRPIERDLEKVLLDLAEEFPLLASLVDTRPGGQKRLPSGRPTLPWTAIRSSRHPPCTPTSIPSTTIQRASEGRQRIRKLHSSRWKTLPPCSILSRRRRPLCRRFETPPSRFGRVGMD